MVETIRVQYGNEVSLDVLVRKGNESLLENHPYINAVLVWDKKTHKYKNLLALSKQIRNANYDIVYNLQRFASTGFLTVRSKAKLKVGFKSNPFSRLFDHKVEHDVGGGLHEIDRNAALLKVASTGQELKTEPPKLYPTPANSLKVDKIVANKRHILVMAPASVWFTKQLPREKWIELIQLQEAKFTIYLIGAPADEEYLQGIIDESQSDHIINMAGQLNLLDSAALIARADRTYVNDSAPLHLASAVNAPVTAFFCSTVPSFGFGPVSSDAQIIEVKEELNCRPCGLHGHKACPQGHFDCGYKIDVKAL
ncbi:MAG: glycosyltransferase family 9 protein [Crocinitomix sp.]|nr:glycosyltransferase family 9 protein [Crocinitomix sp.]